MKKYYATAIVKFKTSVLEPQGKAILLSLSEKGHKEFSQIRVGKFIEVELVAENDREAQAKISQLAEDYLYNSVMETCELKVVAQES
ncbi:MAG: phosphoribosylformylglycinamidine synthase subunit PurS [Leptospiraceae bacterium]|nr:phosphoribosylformylglycinamidine synthase subunit PurS [Leptospiraceae bacterium]